MGYRYYESANVTVRFPFGYGLSYTEFAYSDLKVEGNRVSCTVENAGNLAGKEIVQLYIEPVNSRVHRPVRELKGFEKIELAPGESKKVIFTLNDRSFAIWDNGWKVPDGYYHVCIGRNCHEMCLSEEIYIAGVEVSDAENLPNWYRLLRGIPSQNDLEILLGRKIIEKPVRKGEFTKENTAYSLCRIADSNRRSAQDVSKTDVIARAVRPVAISSTMGSMLIAPINIEYFNFPMLIYILGYQL